MKEIAKEERTKQVIWNIFKQKRIHINMDVWGLVRKGLVAEWKLKKSKSRGNKKEEQSY